MKNVVYLILSMFLLSCENELPFNVEKNPPKLIVNAILTSAKKENDIRLALSGKDNVTYITDATINLFVNGELKEQISKPVQNQSEGLFRTSIDFMPDDIVKIEVKTDDEKYYAWSEDRVIYPLNIENVDFTIVDKNHWNKKYFRVKLSFSDNSNTINYYRLIIEKEFTFWDQRVMVTHIVNENLIAKEDLVLTDGQPSSENDIIGTPVENIYGVFDNSRISGTYTMVASIPYYTWMYEWEKLEMINMNLKIRLQSISLTQYLYLKALNMYDSDSNDDIINSPIKFPNNINGGIGIFGICAETYKTVSIDNYSLFPDF